nr:C40 family peptidase [Paenibacillus lycopersici]
MTIAFTGAAMTIAPQTTHAATSSSTLAKKITATGEKYMGVPYKFGAKAGITSAFDCSSFIQYIFKKNGISLPRSSKQQSKVGVKVSKSNLKAGDLVFSDTNGDGVINHVSLYIGNGKLLHTYRVGIGVTISTFKGSTWDRKFVTARRVL